MIAHKNYLVDATALVYKVFGDKRDKSGAAYVSHCLRVHRRLGPDADIETQAAAILHDVIEDTNYSRAEIAKLFSERIAYLVTLVSRPSGTTYARFIDRIIESGEKSAMRIKLADLFDNTSPSRIVLLDESDRGILDRYYPAISKIEEALGTHSIVNGDIHIPTLEA